MTFDSEVVRVAARQHPHVQRDVGVEGQGLEDVAGQRADVPVVADGDVDLPLGLAGVHAVGPSGDVDHGSGNLRSAVRAVERAGASVTLTGDRHAVWQGLLDRGVLIRETGPDGWLRVSVGTAAEMTAFKQALREVLP